MSEKKMNRVALNDEMMENVSGGILMAVGTAEHPKLNWTNVNTGEVLASYDVIHDTKEVANWLKTEYWDYGDEKAIEYLKSINWIA